MERACLICSHSVTKVTGSTTLPCGHLFHPHCIHNLYKGSSHCPSCPKPTIPLLDFGDNATIAAVTREMVYSSAAAFTPEPAKKGIFGGLFGGGATKKTYPPLATPEELLDLGAPVSVFKERGITLRDIVKAGVKLNHWSKAGYTLKDLQDMGVKWEDMIYMGMTPGDLCRVPASFLVDVLKIDIGHLIQIGTSWNHLAQARYSARDLLSLKCTTHVLMGLGMDGTQMSFFEFTESDWSALALQN